MYLCSSLFRFCDKNKSNEKGRIPSEEADLNFRDAKKFYRTPIIKNTYLLPRDEGGLYNDLSYRRLRSFSVRADDRAQMATSACRDTACRVRQCKDDIVDVSDTACRVPTPSLHL